MYKRSVALLFLTLWVSRRHACDHSVVVDAVCSLDFQVSRAPGSRRPPCDSLYDVFGNIAVDEGEHVKTMAACQDYAVSGKRVVSPHVSSSSSSLANAETKRRLWKEWSEQINTPRSTEMEGY
jgi:hypothetical protein